MKLVGVTCSSAGRKLLEGCMLHSFYNCLKYLESVQNVFIIMHVRGLQQGCMALLRLLRVASPGFCSTVLSLQTLVLAGRGDFLSAEKEGQVINQVHPSAWKTSV